MAARWVGALLYAFAAAAAAAGALAIDDALSLRALRESAPLAAVLGGLLGFGVNSHWPRRYDTAMAAGLLTAIVAIVFFCGLFLLGSTFIEAYLGHSPTEAVADASRRLGERLPVAAPLAVGAFVLAGLVMWAIGGIVRLLGRGRGRRENDGGAGQAQPGR